MTTRKYSSRSQQTTLSSGITSSDATATVVSGANLLASVTFSPAGTFTVVIDPDTALEEIVDVTARSGNTLTITRGVENSGTGVAHSAGAVVRHMVTGRDLREANDHIENTTTAHGITLANIVQTGTTGTVDSAMILDGTIVNADINASAGIVDTKLATISTASKVSNSATTATSANTASAIVARDASGNFTAGTITANLTGNVTGNVTGNLTGNVTGNVSGTSGSTTGNAATATALATGRTISLTGDVTGTSASFDGTGNASITAAIAANSIVDADVNASAAIAWTKIAPSATVSATELGYVDGVTSSIQTQLDSKLATTTATSTYAPLASPALTGVPTAPTAAANTNTTQIATTAYVQTELTDLLNGAPGALDTLNELASALGNDANYSTTITTALAGKLPLAGGTMSGAIAMGTNKVTGLGTPTVSTDAATKAYVDGVTIAPSNLTGPITSVGAATSVAAQTGTGSTFVMQASPTLTTPNIGVATATSVNGTTIPASKTLVATDSTTYVVPSQTGNANKFLTTDGTTSSWGNVAGALAQPTEPSSPQDGQIWIDTDGTAPTTVVTRWTEQPAAGTTVLTGNDDYSIPLAYSPGYEQVFLNGVLLSRSGSEYTATNGTSITLAAATVAGDIVEVICPLQIATTDTYTQSAVNNAFQANTNNFAAGKNKIINGDFGIWQRGTSFTGAAQFTADRFSTYSDSGGTVSRQTFTPGTAPVSGYEGTYFLRVDRSAGGTYANFLQKIEDVRTFAGQTFTVSFWAKASTAQTLTIRPQQVFGTGGSADVIINTLTVNVTTSWARYSATFTAPSVAGKTIGTNSMIYFETYWLTTAAMSVDIWGVQVEAGSTATAFQTATGTIQGELAACQRYYQRVVSSSVYTFFCTGDAYSSTVATVVLPLPVTLRTAPSSIETTGTASNYRLAFGSSSVACSSVPVLDQGATQALGINVTVASGLTTGAAVKFGSNNTASAYIGISAEL